MSEGPPPAPAEDRPAAPMKKVSGLLVVSIFLSISGFLGFAVIGPLAGLITAWFGRRRVKQDPLLIGPRFAMVCIAVGALAFIGNAVSLALMYDKVMWWVAASDRVQAVMKNVSERNFEGAWGEMSEEYRADHEQAAFVKFFTEAFPDQGPIVVAKETFAIREKEWNAEQVGKAAEVLFEDSRPPFEITIPFRLSRSVTDGAEAKPQPVDLDFTIRIQKTGYGKYDARILDLSVRPVPPPVEKKPAEKPAEDAPPDEPK